MASLISTDPEAAKHIYRLKLQLAGEAAFREDIANGASSIGSPADEEELSTLSWVIKTLEALFPQPEPEPWVDGICPEPGCAHHITMHGHGCRVAGAFWAETRCKCRRYPGGGKVP